MKARQYCSAQTRCDLAPTRIQVWIGSQVKHVAHQIITHTRHTRIPEGKQVSRYEWFVIASSLWPFGRRTFDGHQPSASGTSVFGHTASRRFN
jgi:hypothetical protein